MTIDKSKNLELFKAVVEQTADHIMITDKDGVIEYVNQAFEKTTGYSKEELIGKNPRILKSGKHDSQYYHDLWSTILKGDVYHARTTNKKKNGDLYIADQTVTPIINEKGKITHFVSMWKDRTEQIQLQQSVAEEREKLVQVVGFDEKVSSMRKFDYLYDFVVEKVAKIIDASVCVLMLVDWDNERFCPKGFKGINEEQIQRMSLNIHNSVAGDVALSGLPIFVKDVGQDARFKFREVDDYLNHSFLCVPVQVHEHVIGTITVSHKNTEDGLFNGVDLKILHEMANEVAIAIENINLHKELKYLTVTDSLTGCYNFRYFKSALEKEVTRTLRYKRPLCLMMIDVDDMKSYNDFFGHDAGSKMLKAIGQILQEHIREVDTVCRYGGDEFVIILPETNVKESEKVAGKILKEVENYPFNQPVTLSIGVAKCGGKMSAQDLIIRADRALYQAKDGGKNQVCVFD